jgi:hypothetical protein
MESANGNVSAVWCGPHGRGAMRTRRLTKRMQAETRNALTLPENRRKARLAQRKVTK